MANSLMVIYPYRISQTWVFDDEYMGLAQEPFISGTPEIVDTLVQDVAHVDEGFKLVFSAYPFPGYQVELFWLRVENNGHWYSWSQKKMQGWLCPALLNYFNQPPNKIYCKAESLYS
ncbi:hypothetical protein HCG51_23010 [Tolypothrix sp. PCC 7910]|uniref:DUF6717 family protein n=1 Tax=Tolypothrix sp. PCC 7910 TaxID=2099387 RepID=UPI00142798CC|nr:DUF6717 family protein [Tolypothrix sp. PCC 7910]QIR39298.1 hypothetical protein HCG51_23010 [Tolypothrix sp. PCC 7910]